MVDLVLWGEADGEADDGTADRALADEPTGVCVAGLGSMRLGSSGLDADEWLSDEWLRKDSGDTDVVGDDTALSSFWVTSALASVLPSVAFFVCVFVGAVGVFRLVCACVGVLASWVLLRRRLARGT